MNFKMQRHYQVQRICIKKKKTNLNTIKAMHKDVTDIPNDRNCHSLKHAMYNRVFLHI